MDPSQLQIRDVLFCMPAVLLRLRDPSQFHLVPRHERTDGQPKGRTAIPAGVLVPMSSQPDIACRMMYDIFAPHKQLCSTHGNKVLTLGEMLDTSFRKKQNI